MYNINFMRTTLSSCLAGVLILNSALSHADDTEVFFGGPSATSGIKPNVLFILDDSGSMSYELDSTDVATGSTPNRMDVLKQSFDDIITNTNNINVGVMTLNDSPRLIYPVEYIDNPLNITLATPEILVSADDASRQSGSTVIDGPALVMGHINNHAGNTIVRDLSSTSTYSNNNSTYYLNGSYSCSVKIGTTRANCASGTKTELNARSGSSGQTGIFLFRSLNIPSGVSVTSAKLTLTPTNTRSTKPGINIKLENSKTPVALDDASLIGSRDFSSISSTIAYTSPLLPNSWTSGSSFTIDITSQINSLKARSPAADPIADLALQLRAATDSNYTYAVGDVANAPKLEIIYSGGANSSRTTGLRFQNVAIPQGATITSARIDFVPAGSDDRPVTFAVSAQNAGNASEFSAGEDFTGRSKTMATDWPAAGVMPEWRTESPATYVEGPNVLAQAQAVVSSGSWCGNNAMAFFLEPTSGDGSRTAYSIDGAPLKPMLKITYEGGDNGCLRPAFEARITAPKNDARQYCNAKFNGTCRNSVIVAENSMSLSGDTTHIGARYESLPIIRNAQVVDAQIVITNTGSSGSSNISVHVEDASNSSEMLANGDNLGSRTLVGGAGGGMTCTLSGKQSVCSGAYLVSALESIFAKGGSSGWNDGNALSIILKRSSGSGYNVVAYDSNPAESIKLRVKLESGGMGVNFRTVRTHVNSVVQGLVAGGGTPIVPTLYSAARYLSEKFHSDSNPSPMTSSCQPTHLVLLTDGEANNNTTTAKAAISSLTGSSCSGDSDGELCGRELAHWLANTDQSSFDGDNLVITHTVGFALDAAGEPAATNIKNFLRDLATEGGGSTYAAANASDLSIAFNQILQQVLATDTTFVSASAPVNTFNRQDNKDELYFSLFRPSTNDRWLGNLKRYRMKTEDGFAWIVDQDGLAAIDTNTGFFRSDARSWWSSTNDGSDVAAGGVAENLPTPAARNLLTNVSSNPASLTALNTSNIEVDLAKLGAANATERASLISYIRGYDPIVPTTERKALGDPIHATPSLVTYSCDEYTNGVCTDENQSAIFGTNEGFVQMFDTSSGVEQFAFMPQTLLPNIKRLKENAAMGSNSHIYGMDNTVTLWTNDVNKNGVIRSGGAVEAGEFVYAYATMGRGGRDIYALDISNPAAPTMLWQIQGGSGVFSRLNQTWSAPVRTKIKVGGTITDVLVFGGGYDPDQDNAVIKTADDLGNDLYIVNATTGALIWSASSAGIGGMNYSIPSGVSVVGLQTNALGQVAIDPNGLAGQIFVGDMGGQVWRFHVNNAGANSVITGEIFASIAGADAANARRFYHEPEIALATANNALNLTVSIGSGYRGHPLDKIIDDRFYSFRTANLADSSTTLTETNLKDATSLTTATAAQIADLLTKDGWYIRLVPDGEKVLSRPLAINGKLYFNTYEPKANQNSCQAATGTTRAYQVDLLTSTALAATRFTISKGGSLPSNPQLYCKGNTCWAYNDPSQLTQNGGGGGGGGGCETAANPEKCKCDRNPMCTWVPTTPRSFWFDEQ